MSLFVFTAGVLTGMVIGAAIALFAFVAVMPKSKKPNAHLGDSDYWA